MKLPKFSFEKKDIKAFLVFGGVVAAVILGVLFFGPYLPVIGTSFFYVSMLVLVAVTWGLAGHAVLKSLFLVGANLSLMIFLAQAYCEVPTEARTANEALMSLIGFAVLYIGYEFVCSVFKEVKGRMATFREANNDKNPWLFVIFFALFTGLFLVQVGQVLQPILHNLCVYK
jgi:Na+/phosphate symporter